MKSVNSEDNPIMIIHGAESRTMCYMKDIGAHMDVYFKHMMEQLGPPPVDTLIMNHITRASDKEIEEFEAQFGIAVPTIEEAIAFYNAEEKNYDA